MKSDFISLNNRNIWVWWLLAFQAGAINAGGFIAAHRFVTHTTGFATHFGVELASAHWEAALGMVSVPAFFLLGAMITSYYVDLPQRRGRRPNYRTPSALIFLTVGAATLLGELGVFGIFGESLILRRDYLFLMLLCLASGLQNALITNANGVVVRTTHLTGVTTDLAVGLVRAWLDRSHHETRREHLANVARVGILAAFVLGSVLSAILFLRAEYLGFLLPVGTSIIMMRYFYL